MGLFSYMLVTQLSLFVEIVAHMKEGDPEPGGPYCKKYSSTQHKCLSCVDGSNPTSEGHCESVCLVDNCADCATNLPNVCDDCMAGYRNEDGVCRESKARLISVIVGCCTSFLLALLCVYCCCCDPGAAGKNRQQRQPSYLLPLPQTIFVKNDKNKTGEATEEKHRVNPNATQGTAVLRTGNNEREHTSSSLLLTEN